MRKTFVLWFLGPAMAFWLPDLVIHWHYGATFDGDAVDVLTLLLPISTVTTVFLLTLESRPWQLEKTRSPVIFSLASVCGIWITGPLLMTISFTIGGAGFATPYGWITATLGTLLWPIFCFSMSAYDGSLYALLLTTLMLPLIALIMQAWQRFSAFWLMRHRGSGAARSLPSGNNDFQ
jgi:hypothetical protein